MTGLASISAIISDLHMFASRGRRHAISRVEMLAIFDEAAYRDKTMPNFENFRNYCVQRGNSLKETESAIRILRNMHLAGVSKTDLMTSDIEALYSRLHSSSRKVPRSFISTITQYREFERCES